jgi:hypothetical protein
VHHRRATLIRPQIDLADARKQVDVSEVHVVKRGAVKQDAANRLAVKQGAANLPALKPHAVKARAAIRLDVTAVGPTERLGHHGVVLKSRPHAPLHARKLAARKAFAAMTTLSSSMMTMPTVSAAAYLPRQNRLPTKATNLAQDRGDVVGVEAVVVQLAKIVLRSKVRPN